MNQSHHTTCYAYPTVWCISFYLTLLHEVDDAQILNLTAVLAAQGIAAQVPNTPLASPQPMLNIS